MNTAPYTECYIVAGGPSLKGFNWSLLDDKFVIAINRSYEVLPNAKIIYFTDNDFWDVHKNNMLRHKGQKIKGSLQRKKANDPAVIDYNLTGPNGLETAEKSLRHGHNSTYAAINLAAVHLKFKKIYLLGVDMKWGEKRNRNTSHWHDGHKRRDPESVYERMMKAYDTIHQPLKNMGVEVININNDSALKVFPQKTFQEMFGDKYQITTGTREMTDPKLLGDKVETVIEALGGKQIAKAIERVTKKPCNCAKRKEALNNLHRKLLRAPTPPRIMPVIPTPRKVSPPPRIMPRAPAPKPK